MKIITFSHQKGGVGKSTLSMNTAISLAQENFNVGILDFDKQNSAYKILSNIDSINIYTDHEKINSEHDFLIIDTPPYLDKNLRDLYEQSDLVIVPFKVSPLDIIHASDTIKMLEKAQGKGIEANRKRRLVVNQYISSSSLFEDLADEIKELDVTVFNTKIENRTSFIRSIILQNAIYGTKDKKAIKMIDELREEILQII